MCGIAVSRVLTTSYPSFKFGPTFFTLSIGSPRPNRYESFVSAASVVMSAPGRTPAAWSFCEGGRRGGKKKEGQRGRKRKEKRGGEGGGRRVS